MDVFSISQLAQYSGIKPHTIRMWEQRYNALQPRRSEGNTRSYDGGQLRRLLNISSLMGQEYKVSELCGMDDEKLFALVREKEKEEQGNDLNEYFIKQLISAGVGFEEARFGKIFSHCILRYGIRNTYVQVLYPMLRRLGLMWAGNDLPPAHEHFLSNIIKGKLFTALDSLPPEESDKDSWLLFLPENELHEIPLLFSAYLIRLAGKKVFYLGGNVPLSSLSLAVRETAPSNLLVFFIHYDFPGEVQEYLNVLIGNFQDQKLYLSGNEDLISKLELTADQHWIPSVDDLEIRLKENTTTEYSEKS